MTLTSTNVGSQKNFSSKKKGDHRPKGSSNFGGVRVHLLVDASMIIMYMHMGVPKSFQLYVGMYIVLSFSTKSMTLKLTNIGSPKIFQNGTVGRKARRILVV